MSKYQMTFVGAIIFLTAIVLNAGCTRNAGSEDLTKTKYDNVKIYFRSFDQLALVSYNEETLINNAQIKLSLSDPDQIFKADGLTSMKCDKAEEFNGKMDMYLLVNFFRNGEVAKQLRASKFHFISNPGESYACVFKPADRDAIQSWLESIK